MKKSKNVLSLNSIILMIVTSAILVQGIMWLIDSIYLFRNDIEDLNQIQTDYVKAQLKERVASVIDYTDYRSQETESVLRDELKSRTYEAYAVMDNIYNQNKETHSREEITGMIKDALRDIRFNDGRGYFFIDTLEGDVVLYPAFPENEGSNFIDLKDDDGQYVVRNEVETVESLGEGFVEGYWIKPDSDDTNTYKKLTFVKAFEPYGWYLGCGDYVDEMTKTIQEEVLEYVDTIKYGEDHIQYVFLHDYNGVELANGIYPELVGLNHYELEDINGAKVYQEQIKLCVESGGGYLEHYWPNQDGQGYYRKLTYVEPLPQWEWVIGTGVDVSDLDNRIQLKEKELTRFIATRILMILAVLTCLLIATFIYVQKFMSKVNKNFSIFRDAMISAKMKLKPIQVENLDYTDFSELAEVTNSMTERINHLLHYDELTGTYNRRAIMEMLDQILAQSPENTGIIIMDVDFFKKVNDNFGHEAGDETLKITANQIKANTPESGYVGRFGGEEFIIILPDFGLEKVTQVAEKIRKEVESCYIEAIRGHITISGGIAHSKTFNRDRLFAQADQMLYKAKESGRNRIES